MTDIASSDFGAWLSPSELNQIRSKVPLVYLNLVPVKLDTQGRLEAVALLLRGKSRTGMIRSLVAGRILLHETLREAVCRHLEKDLGPMCLPVLPTTLVPFNVAEYFPIPGSTLYDERQHAIALCYVIPVNGDCQAYDDALEISWFTPQECLLPEVISQLEEGHQSVLKQALAHLGYLR